MLLKMILYFLLIKIHKMKKFNLIILVFLIGFQLTSFRSIGQNQSSKEILNELSNSENSFSMSISKEIIDAFDVDIDLNGKENWIGGDFLKGNLLIIDNEYTGSTVKKMFLKKGFELVDMEEEDNSDSEVSLLVERSGKQVKEAHFVVDNDGKTIVLSIYGNIKVKNKK